jgi:3-deoxy-7-phosphoheptulonate synthase
MGTEIKKKIVDFVSGDKTYSIGNGTFSVFAGPCSIESYPQFSETAQSVKNSGACLLRGGIWKLRTSAKTFQGLGNDAFDVVKKVTSEVNMSLVSEVTDPRQIETIYPFVSMFQVGSRNMHNYALLKELANQDKPVLLKRGFAALVDEWLKAAEYVDNAGKAKVILCERGIRTFETATRNTLDLNAVAFVKHNSPYPVIVDPSHAVGISALVPDLSLAAAAMGADGIILEVHPSPKDALSDGPQALTPDQFAKLMVKIEKVLTALDRKLQKES